MKLTVKHALVCGEIVTLPEPITVELPEPQDFTLDIPPAAEPVEFCPSCCQIHGRPVPCGQQDREEGA